MVRKGVSIVSIDEYKTSKTCHKCGADNKYRRSVIYDGGTRSYPSFWVLSCKNLNCGITMNRDGARNMHHLPYNYLNDSDRPTWLKRPPKTTITAVGSKSSKLITSVDSS